MEAIGKILSRGHLLPGSGGGGGMCAQNAQTSWLQTMGNLFPQSSEVQKS